MSSRRLSWKRQSSRAGRRLGYELKNADRVRRRALPISAQSIFGTWGLRGRASTKSPVPDKPLRTLFRTVGLKILPTRSDHEYGPEPPPRPLRCLPWASRAQRHTFLRLHSRKTPMRIREVSWSNYRRLPDGHIVVRDHLILVGPNDSGKSSVLRALHLCLGMPQPQLAA
jgi:AAA ATPase-like protein